MEKNIQDFYIFPIKKGAKNPPLVAWKEHSTNDKKQIEKWKKKFPGCNWGVDCEKSNLCVIDLDFKPDKNGMKSLLELEKDKGLIESNYVVKTPNGGLHIYTEGLTKSHIDLYPGVDIKSIGGYVLAAGSTVNSKKYTVIKKG